MSLSNKQLGVIHVAKKQLGLSEAEYRSILRDIGGVNSSRELSREGFDAVMFHFHQMGFSSTWSRRNLGFRPGMASPGQVALMRSLWNEFTDGEGTEASFNKWLDHKFGVSAVRFLDRYKANLVIGAMKLMTRDRAA